MAREQDTDQIEWVNVWAEWENPASKMPKAEPFVVAAAALAEPTPPPPVIAPPLAPVPPISADQLMRDIAEIERVRDVLAAQPSPVFARHRTQALTLVPSRTSDAVPVVIGGVLALVMLTVFGAAAAMTKLAR